MSTASSASWFRSSASRHADPSYCGRDRPYVPGRALRGGGSPWRSTSPSNDTERELAPDVEPAPDLDHDGAEHEGAGHEGHGHDGVVVGAAGVAVRRRGGGASDALGGSSIGDDITETLRRRSGGGSPLPAGLASSYGAAYGADLSGVRVHDDGEADSVARSVQSVAFTHGQDVYFSRGAYSPGGGGDHTLAHELAHVAQSKTGRHGGGAGTIGRADDPAEADADRMAGSALGGLRRMAAGAVDAASASAPTLGAIRRLKDGEEKDLEGAEVEDQEVLDEAVGGAGAMFDDEEKRGERREKGGGGLTDEVVGGVGTIFADEEKRGERRGKGGGGLTDEVVGGVGTMLADEEKRGQRRGKKGGGGLTNDSVDGVGKLVGDEEKRNERRERRQKGGGGLSDEVVGGVGTMFSDEEKRGQRRRKKGGGGITGDSVEGVSTMIEDEEKIADKRDERRRRKQRGGGLTLGSAADVAELFDLQDRDWFTDDVVPNPKTPKKFLPAGATIIEVVGGTNVNRRLNQGVTVSPKPANPDTYRSFVRVARRTTSSRATCRKIRHCPTCETTRPSSRSTTRATRSPPSWTTSSSTRWATATSRPLSRVWPRPIPVRSWT